MNYNRFCTQNAKRQAFWRMIPTTLVDVGTVTRWQSMYKNIVDKRNRKQWKCQTVESTDWNSRENAKMQRKDLADTINAANEQLGIAVHWEHRSFKEQGIDREPIA